MPVLRSVCPSVRPSVHPERFSFEKAKTRDFYLLGGRHVKRKDKEKEGVRGGEKGVTRGAGREWQRAMDATWVWPDQTFFFFD